MVPGRWDAFDPESADFSAMAGMRDLFISNALYQAFAVGEAGSEAAAATVVTVGDTSLGPVEFPEITIDRPFFFLIRDNPTGAILFLGHVTNPAAQELSPFIRLRPTGERKERQPASPQDLSGLKT
jgi:serine protease inhibitor